MQLFYCRQKYILVCGQQLPYGYYHDWETNRVENKALTVDENWSVTEYTFFYKKPRVRGSGSAFLRIPDFKSQKILKLIKIPVFSFLKFSYFESLIFLKFYTKNTSRTIILDFGQKRCYFASNFDESTK